MLKSPIGGNRIQAQAKHEPTDRGALFVFFGVGAVYLLTLSGNLSIAHDSVMYAAKILTFSPAYHPNHLLYEPFLSGVLRGLAEIGVPPTVPTLEAISAVAGATAVAGAFKTLVGPLGVTRRNAAFTVVACAASFGPWYYSVGVEIYIFPLTALVWCFYTLLGAGGRAAAVAAAAVLHAVAILLHQTSILFALVPVLVLLGNRDQRIRDRVSLLALYVLIGSAVVAGAYGMVALTVDRITSLSSFSTWFLGYGASDQYWSPASPKALLLGLIAFGRAVIGGHFVFALEPLREPLQIMFSNKDLADEIFLLHQAPASLIWLLLAATVLWGLLMLWTAVSMVKTGVSACRNHSGLLMLLAWFVPYAAFFIAWDGGNVDFWVNQVFVAWMIVGLLVDRILPARTASTHLCALALGLVVINGAGTILPAANEENDFLTRKVLTLTAKMRPDGILVVADDWPDARHIRFRTKLEVIPIAAWRRPDSLKDVLRQRIDAGRSVYLWPDVFGLSSASRSFYGQRLIESVRSLRGQLCGTTVLSTFAELEAHEVTCIR